MLVFLTGCCVKQKNDELRWASRWDTYLKMDDPQIHWFSIINSLMIVLFLTGMVAMIMMRTLHADFQRCSSFDVMWPLLCCIWFHTERTCRYREMETQEELQEETGWKLVHGDVFRPPSNPMFLAVLVGNGVQVQPYCACSLGNSGELMFLRLLRCRL